SRRSHMHTETVLFFKPYPFTAGQKIYIDGGPRRGDWEVIDVNERKIKLRCPISRKEIEWNQFCYFVEERRGEPWPHSD
ncbi:MAG: hypothetical protein PVF62_17380, partial [Desulfobacterales bacterium]